ncbi:histone deacetylation protein Rxt3-domain-containing protein [Dichotomocladium elegans]|nr:histone deacetylation protein Rxt3-domain-containing protein [Dichotomocladium elegans]
MEVTKRIVRNDKVWQGLAGFQEKRLGTYLYRPGKLFPVNAAQLNGCIDVLIPAVYLTYHNPEVKRRALWGTDIYTDDSDVVAMIVHCGKYSMPFVEPDIAPNDPLFLALGIDPAYTISTTATGLARSRNGSRSKSTTIPDHDLKVTLRVVPALKHYNGTIQNYIASRTWGSNHDGVSYHVERVEKTPKGLAQPCGRHAIKANMTQYAYDRYVTVGLPKTATTIQGDDEIMEEITPDMLWKPRSKKKKVALTSPSPTAEATQPSSASPDTPTTTGRRRTVRRAASKNRI